MIKAHASFLLLAATLLAATGCAQSPAPMAAPAAVSDEAASGLLDRVSAKASYDVLASGSKTVYQSLWFLVHGPTGKPSLDFNEKANDNLNVTAAGTAWKSGVFLGKNRTLYIQGADGKALYAVGTFGPAATPKRDQAVTFKFAAGTKFKVKADIRSGNDFPPLPERHVALHLDLNTLPKAEKADVLLVTTVD
jgi:hypothetical protein